MASPHSQVGAATGVSARWVHSLSDKASARTAIKLGTAGVELEVGASRRLSEHNTGGLSVVVGLAVGSPADQTPPAPRASACAPLADDAHTAGPNLVKIHSGIGEEAI